MTLNTTDPDYPFVEFPSPGERPDSALESYTLFLSERRRTGGVVTRADQGTIGLERSGSVVIQTDPDDKGTGHIGDAVMLLNWSPPLESDSPSLRLRLAPSEARSIAAALLRTADLMEREDAEDIGGQNSFILGMHYQHMTGGTPPHFPSPDKPAVVLKLADSAERAESTTSGGVA